MADFALRDMQDVSLYKLSWGARLCWTRRLLVCPVRLPFALRDMQDVSLYKLSWGARLCYTRRLLVCPVRLPFSPFIRPVGPSLVRRDIFHLFLSRRS